MNIRAIKVCNRKTKYIKYDPVHSGRESRRQQNNHKCTSCLTHATSSFPRKEYALECSFPTSHHCEILQSHIHILIQFRDLKEDYSMHLDAGPNVLALHTDDHILISSSSLNLYSIALTSLSSGLHARYLPLCLHHWKLFQLQNVFYKYFMNFGFIDSFHCCQRSYFVSFSVYHSFCYRLFLSHMTISFLIF